MTRRGVYSLHILEIFWHFFWLLTTLCSIGWHHALKSIWFGTCSPVCVCCYTLRFRMRISFIGQGFLHIQGICCWSLVAHIEQYVQQYATEKNQQKTKYQSQQHRGNGYRHRQLFISLVWGLGRDGNTKRLFKKIFCSLLSCILCCFTLS